jgi:hypothetical protein
MFAALLEGGGSAEGSGRGFAIVEETIREAQQQGEVRPGEPAPLTRVVWALLHGASMLRMDGDGAEIRFSAEVLRSGLSNRHTPAVSPQAAD